MLWTFDRVVNFTEERLKTITQVLNEFKDNYDYVKIYEKMVELNYVQEPSIPNGKTKEQIYYKRWGSYVGTINAYGIATTENNKARFTDITEAYLGNEITFQDFVRIQMAKWQLPNGALTDPKINEYLNEGILIKPFILTLQVMLSLYTKNKLEGWLDPYDINTYLLSAKDNSDTTVENIVDSILTDRKEKKARNVAEFKLDVIFNTFCSTNFIHKIDAPSFIPVSNLYVLNDSELNYISEIINEHREPKFTDEDSIKNKTKWLRYYGTYVNLSINKSFDGDSDVMKNFKGINLVIYGAPGTGKSHELDKRYGTNVNTTRVTFHPEYTYHDFVGNYRPEPLYKVENSTSTIPSKFITEDNVVFEKGEPYINYRFVPGPFTLVLEKAIESLQNDVPEMFTLIIEELNRANTPAVFGDLFQLLDRESNGESTYGVSNLEVLKYLKGKGVIAPNQTEIKIPYNLNIVATMNSADQGVFVMDSAFKRRWLFEYLPINAGLAIHKDEAVSYNGSHVTWRDFIQSINDLLADLSINEDRHIGPYFLKQGEPSNQKVISSKLLMYLWDDVARLKRTKIFKDEIKTFSQLVGLYENGHSIFKIDFKYIQNSIEEGSVEDSEEVTDIDANDKNE